MVLSLETGHAYAAPSARDLAYEQGVQAEEAGEHARAAAEFTRAYRLTPTNEAGPRLLFLRASVAAHLRAHDGRGEHPEHLCQARALLREHLDGAAEGGGPDPLADERTHLARIESDLGTIDCDARVAEPVPPVPRDSPSNPSPPASEPLAPQRPDLERAPASPPPLEYSQLRQRRLRIAGWTSLGVGAAALVSMSVGIALTRAAMRKGQDLCWNMANACDYGDKTTALRQILADGRDAELLVKLSAPLTAAALVAGIVLLSLGFKQRPARLTPTIAPGAFGLGLQGRF
ncbi:hypothetical protein [Nannocystis pusilla]|uniref:hypothetical protein n=1 Tax=Nannocystis pusilla TaxID=889268 RepID=UPI003BF16832